MKKLVSIIVSVFMLAGAFCLCAFAEDMPLASADVYVTIADGEGKLALTQEKISGY